MQLGRKGFATTDADVAISLSPRQEDTIMLSSALLSASHPMFAVGLSGRWGGAKLLMDRPSDGSTFAYRYELEMTSDGVAVLVAKV